MTLFLLPLKQQRDPHVINTVSVSHLVEQYNEQPLAKNFYSSFCGIIATNQTGLPVNHCNL